MKTMETIQMTDPDIGSAAWWNVVDAHMAAYEGYPDVQQSIFAEASATSRVAAAVRQAACAPAGAFAMAGANT